VQKVAKQKRRKNFDKEKHMEEIFARQQELHKELER
jgi:hypothetical protein